MAEKRNKRTGLARPEPEGVDGLFGGAEPTVQELSEEQAASQSTDAQPEDEGVKDKRVKTSFYLSPEAHELLHDLKYAARKGGQRSVSIGKLMDRAIFDLAKKMNVTNN